MTTAYLGAWPDFLIIGAGKSGTTSLHHYLQQHPDIFMSEVKEPNFFALKDEAPVDTQDDKQQFFHYPWAVRDPARYRALFSEAKPHQRKGESSTMYLYRPEALPNIKEYVPEVKLVAIFRQPAERLYSRYLHLAREDRLPTPYFEDVTDTGSLWWQRNDLVPEGFYYRHLARFFEAFPSENIKVFLYEHLQHDATTLIRELYHFLEVDPDFTPQLGTRYNQSGFIKNRFYDTLVGQRSVLKNSVASVLPGVYQMARKSPDMQRILNKLRAQNLHKPTMSEATWHYLTHEVYREDIEQLQTLLKIDLSHWWQRT